MTISEQIKVLCVRCNISVASMTKFLYYHCLDFFHYKAYC